MWSIHQRCYEGVLKLSCGRVCFLTTLQALPSTLLKRDSGSSFPVNFAKFLRTLFLQNTPRGPQLHFVVQNLWAPVMIITVKVTVMIEKRSHDKVFSLSLFCLFFFLLLFLGFYLLLSLVSRPVVHLFLLYIFLPFASTWNTNGWSSHRRCSVRKDVLGNFVKLTGKHLCQGLFFNEIAGQACNVIKK